MDKLWVFSETIEVLKTKVRFKVRRIFSWGDSISGERFEACDSVTGYYELLNGPTMDTEA